MDKVFANQKKANDAYERNLKAEILKTTPKPDGAGSGSETVTKEQFEAMSYAERLKLYNENNELYNELNGGN